MMATEAKAVSTGTKAWIARDVSKVSTMVDAPTAKFIESFQARAKELKSPKEMREAERGMTLGGPIGLGTIASMITPIEFITSLAMAPFGAKMEGNETPEEMAKMARGAVREETGSLKITEAIKFKLEQLAEDAEDEESAERKKRFERAEKAIYGKDGFADRYEDLVRGITEKVKGARDYESMGDYAYELERGIASLVHELYYKTDL